MLGTIGVENLKVECIIGDLPKERTHKQHIFVDFKVHLDFSDAAKTDNVNDTLCYAALSAACLDIAQKNQFHLLETYAHAIIATFLKHKKVSWAWVRIKKPGAIAGADFAFVELEKSKDER